MWEAGTPVETERNTRVNYIMGVFRMLPETVRINHSWSSPNDCRLHGSVSLLPPPFPNASLSSGGHGDLQDIFWVSFYSFVQNANGILSVVCFGVWLFGGHQTCIMHAKNSWLHFPIKGSHIEGFGGETGLHETTSSRSEQPRTWGKITVSARWHQAAS